jgi:hypothetical protein
MTEQDMMTRYNYHSFTTDNVKPWLNFDNSPPLGQKAPDFPLWHMEDGAETRLSEVWSQHLYTVVEFGSFT